MLYDKFGVFVGTDSFSDVLEHYGTPRHSGRYPWGSGDNPYQRSASFLSSVNDLKARGYSQVEIAKSMNMTSGDLRKEISLATAEIYQYNVSEAQRLFDKGMSKSAIARRMGTGESTVRDWLKSSSDSKLSRANKNATLLKNELDENGGYLMVGAGVEMYLNGVSQTSLNNTLKKLENEGYAIHNIQVQQLGTGKYTTMKVLAKPGTTKKEVTQNRDKIRMPVDIYAEDDGETLRKVEPYQSVDPKRVMVKYDEDGGTDKDGVIEVRRGVADLDLGRNHYVQGRILIDNSHYAKGMVMYADDHLPDGIDIRINSNKKRGTPLLVKGDADAKQVLKPIKEGQENPFGANLKDDDKLTRAQRHYIGEDGQEHLSAINIVKEEGDVDKWTKTLSSQFLSKQSPGLAKAQLKQYYDICKSELDEIASYTNPTIKRSMAMDFAEQCESDAVHLQAASLPRQSTKFILPLTNIKEDEIYAPGYRDGEEVALIRFPHASISEIPKLRVNNSNPFADSVITKEARDAVGIHPKAAERLSGADFDGDTVLVIPTSTAAIRNKPQFEELKDFDTKSAYPGYPGMHKMTSHEKGQEMGKITNLITDMTVLGANDRELARALKHSMVIIDSEKHGLDYKRSEQENGIAELRENYQPKGDAGRGTLLSRSTKEEHVPDRKEKPVYMMSEDEKKRWDNGEMIYMDTGDTLSKPKYYKKLMTVEEKADYNSGDARKVADVERAMRADGRVVWKQEGRTIKSTQGREHDPYELVSGGSREKTSKIERVYADHAVAMKDLARQARKLAREQVDIPRDPEMAKKYSAEVESLNAKLNIAKKNAPLEALAQNKAGLAMRQIIYDHPELKEDNEHYKREKGRQLDKARKAVGAKKLTIGSERNQLTDREWEAIQAGAISKTKLNDIVKNCDKKRLKELALPRESVGVSSAKLSRARMMLSNGYSQADVADALDISVSTLVKALD